MTLRQRRQTALAIVFSGVVLTVWGTDTGGIWRMVLGMALLLGGLALDAVWVRCSQCGRWLGWNTGPHCPGCGTAIPWDGDEPF